MHAKLGVLSEEQLAAVEALTRGLVNKFLHPPMQALKQAARENDSTRVDALCEAWSLPSVAEPAPRPVEAQEDSAPSAHSVAETKITERSETSAVGGK